MVIGLPSVFPWRTPDDHVRAVALDLHAAAAAMAELAPRKVAVETLLGERQSGREPLHDRGEAGPVGLPARREADRHQASQAIQAPGLIWPAEL